MPVLRKDELEIDKSFSYDWVVKYLCLAALFTLLFMLLVIAVRLVDNHWSSFLELFRGFPPIVKP